jgi:hypothetical protein
VVNNFPSLKGEEQRERVHIYTREGGIEIEREREREREREGKTWWIAREREIQERVMGMGIYRRPSGNCSHSLAAYFDHFPKLFCCISILFPVLFSYDVCCKLKISLSELEVMLQWTGVEACCSRIHGTL